MSRVNKKKKRGSGERARGVAACICMHAGYALPKPSLFRRLWISIPDMRLPLCRINSDGEKQPLTASAHTAFHRHCMKIDGFDIISTASLSHMPAVARTGRDQPVPSILDRCSDGKACFPSLHVSLPLWRLCAILYLPLRSHTQTHCRGWEGKKHLISAGALIPNTPALIKGDKYAKKAVAYQPKVCNTLRMRRRGPWC